MCWTLLGFNRRCILLAKVPEGDQAAVKPAKAVSA